LAFERQDALGYLDLLLPYLCSHANSYREERDAGVEHGKWQDLHRAEANFIDAMRWQKKVLSSFAWHKRSASAP